jgi:hypothetical protein
MSARSRRRDPHARAGHPGCRRRPHPRHHRSATPPRAPALGDFVDTSLAPGLVRWLVFKDEPRVAEEPPTTATTVHHTNASTSSSSTRAAARWSCRTATTPSRPGTAWSYPASITPCAPAPTAPGSSSSASAPRRLPEPRAAPAGYIEPVEAKVGRDGFAVRGGIGAKTLRSVRAGPSSVTFGRACCIAMLSHATRSLVRQSCSYRNSGR